MKFLILAALVAVAVAYPVEEESVREKRGILSYAAPGLVYANPGYLGVPSVVAARTVYGAPIAPVASAVLDARSGTAVVAPTPVSGGAVLSPGASVVGPSPLGTVGVVAANGYAWV